MYVDIDFSQRSMSNVNCFRFNIIVTYVEIDFSLRNMTDMVLILLSLSKTCLGGETTGIGDTTIGNNILSWNI